jgi:GNAT superfamily N-acetyltransferase
MAMIERILVSHEVDETTSRTIEHGLIRYNESCVGPDPSRPIWIVCRDEQEKIIGGVQGFIQLDWFYVAILWINEDFRRRGIGTHLMSEAEDAARKNGCIRMRLATITFQAPEFYKKLGYIEVCRVPDLPPGHSLIWMSKILSD